jgi:DMSO/TMAO reductase YedYZ molybdopterin-dependent catalytic subunit
MTAAVARGARTNLALLALMAAAFLTGWLAFAFATAPSRWSLVVHATSGFAIIALLPWKSIIARRGARRAQPGRWASILLAVLVLVSLAAGLAHSSGIALSIGPLPAMDYHVGAALVAVPLVIWHVVARRIRLRPADYSRRAMLRGGAVLGSAAVAYAATELIVRATSLPGAARRFTGSYDAGSHNPDALPVSNWLFDPVPNIDVSTWTLRAPGRTWTYEELAAFDDRVTATLDCTGGFYSTQAWSGVTLDRILGAAGGSTIRVVSHTGYDRRFPIDEAPRLLLATRIEGRQLDPGHGFPTRIVSADRRGFWWVKWVVALEVDDVPHWWQSPFPLQ